VPTSVSIRIIDGTSLKNKNGDDPFIHILFIKTIKNHDKLKKKKKCHPPWQTRGWFDHPPRGQHSKQIFKGWSFGGGQTTLNDQGDGLVTPI
jgi:hypothetical protein